MAIPVTPRFLADSTTFKAAFGFVENNRQNGSVTMSGATYDIVFGKPIAGGYIISLTGNSSVPCWYSDKTSNGFRIHAADGMKVDWIVQSILIT